LAETFVYTNTLYITIIVVFLTAISTRVSLLRDCFTFTLLLYPCF